MERIGRDTRLALLAGRQAGAFSFAQARDLGFPSSTIADRLRRGTWTRRRPGVYAVTGTEPTRLHELWVASLAVGPAGALTHETAALCHGAERLPEHPVVLTNPHGAHHHLPGLFVHQIDDLAEHHRTTWNGLAISRPARCVVELAATQPERVVGAVLDDLLRMGKVRLPQVHRVVADVLRPGKPGMASIARVLDQRGEGYVPPQSELERALFDALAAGGLPAPSRQVPLPGRGPIRGLADAGYLDVKILLEVDGRRWHQRVEASARDKARDLQVIRAGWLPIRLEYEHIVRDPGEMCAAIADVRAERAVLLRTAA
jgi:very-short-patch-repair endonuclease